LVVGVLVVTAVVVFFVMRIGTVTFDEPLYRYENGVRIDYEGTSSIRHEEDTFFISSGGRETELPHAPVYFSNDKGHVFLPNQMIYVDPTGTSPLRRTGYNTELVRTAAGDGGGGAAGGTTGAASAAGSVVAHVNGEEATLTGGFLFDGHNTYVFLEPMTVIWGGQEREMPAYSFAVVHYNLRFELYPQFDEGGIVVEQNGEDIVRAVAASGAYTIDMSKDILQTTEQEMLLFTEPSLLEFLG
jgi:hypothetical protein